MSSVSAIEIVPSGLACGAEVRGVRVSALDDAGFDAVHAALVAHGVLVFREQALGEAEQIAFTRRFGAPDRYSLSAYCLPDCPEILLVSNLQVDGRNIGLADAGTTWHTDSSYLAVPPFATLLYAKEVPVRDGVTLGDTLFASAAAAYDALPAALRARLDGLVAVHSYAGKHAARARLGRSDRQAPTAAEQDRLAPVRHPVVRRHPVSRRKALYVAEGECTAIEGMAAEEARALLAELAARVVDPAFQYRHQWRVGDLVVWDNCQVQHLAIKDYTLSERRLLHRTQVKGTVPV
jgi:alpha-ketoglutarate-dependent taurine dioxygenase